MQQSPAIRIKYNNILRVDASQTLSGKSKVVVNRPVEVLQAYMPNNYCAAVTVIHSVLASVQS